LSIGTGQTYNFTHSSTWTPSATGAYTITAWTSNVNGTTDPISSNDSESMVVNIVDQTLSLMPLYENFTSNTCGPCASFNPGFQTLANANNVNGINGPVGITNIKYQMDWPGSADQSFNADGNTRRTYYGVSGIPDHYINGSGGNASQSEIDTYKAAYAFIDISAVSTVSGNDLTVDVTINPIADFPSSDLKLHIAVTEDSYSNNAGTNGETDFYNVMRKMLPDASGTSIGPLTNGTTVTHSETYTFTIGNVTPNSYNVWQDMDNLTVIVFVQDNATQEVYQAAAAISGLVGFTLLPLQMPVAAVQSLP